jgi:hypothetical protein
MAAHPTTASDPTADGAVASLIAVSCANGLKSARLGIALADREAFASQDLPALLVTLDPVR